MYDFVKHYFQQLPSLQSTLYPNLSRLDAWWIAQPVVFTMELHEQDPQLASVELETSHRRLQSVKSGSGGSSPGVSSFIFLWRYCFSGGEYSQSPLVNFY